MSEIIVSREAIKADILAGYSKRPTDKAYNPEIGSIMEKYNLTEKELRLVFKDPDIKATKFVPKVLFEEDLSEDVFKRLMKNQKEFRKPKVEEVVIEKIEDDLPY